MPLEQENGSRVTGTGQVKTGMTFILNQDTPNVNQRQRLARYTFEDRLPLEI